jgi:hypothetical protein
MLWAGWLVVREGRAPTRKTAGAMVVAVAGLLVIQQVLQINAGWSRADRLQDNNHNDALGIYLASNTVENAIEVPVRIHYHVWSSWHFDAALAYLKENGLNVFSDRFPPSPLLERHILSRDGYVAATDSLRIADPGGQSDPAPALNGTIAADWDLQANRLNLQNNDPRAVYLRLELVREVTKGPGGFISISGADGASRIRVYKGKQNLYFRVAPGDSLRVDFLSPTRIGELEIRA